MFSIKERFKSIVTLAGLTNSNRAIHDGDAVEIIEVRVGQGRNLNAFYEPGLADPLPGAWGFISKREWGPITQVDGTGASSTREGLIFNLEVFNSHQGMGAPAISQNSFVRELEFVAEYQGEQYIHAYAWLREDEPDVNNLLTPPDEPGIPDELIRFTIPFWLTNTEDAHLTVRFDALGFVTLEKLLSLLGQLGNGGGEVPLFEDNPANILGDAPNASVGDTLTIPRANHRHPVNVNDSAPTQIAATSTPGASTVYSRVDHVHGTPFETAASNLLSDAPTASLGTSGNIPRSNHRHPANVNNDAPRALEVTAAPGASTVYSRVDHVHPLPPGLNAGAWELIFSRTTSGTQNWTVPDRLAGRRYEIGVFVVGGGGGGAIGSAATAEAFACSGGAGGETEWGTLTASPGQVYSITAGAGGAARTRTNIAASATTNGANGATSSFSGAPLAAMGRTPISANGGEGGRTGSGLGAIARGANGGQGSDGVLQAIDLLPIAPSRGARAADVRNTATNPPTWAFGGNSMPAMCLNPFTGEFVLAAGGGSGRATTTPQQGFKFPNGLGGGNANWANGATSAVIAEDGTSAGCGGGAAIAINSSGQTIIGGAGAPGGVFIYAREVL